MQTEYIKKIFRYGDMVFFKELGNLTGAVGVIVSRTEDEFSRVVVKLLDKRTGSNGKPIKRVTSYAFFLEHYIEGSAEEEL